MNKRTYEISLIGLGVVAVATLAFGVAHRAGKARHEASIAREPLEGEIPETGELTAGSAEGEALSSPADEASPPSIRSEPLPRDEALADIWGTELPEPQRVEELQLSGDLASELEARGDTYDGLEPEDIGAEWLARATEAPAIPPTGVHRLGELSVDGALAAESADRDPDEIGDDELDKA